MNLSDGSKKMRVIRVLFGLHGLNLKILEIDFVFSGVHRVCYAREILKWHQNAETIPPGTLF